MSLFTTIADFSKLSKLVEVCEFTPADTRDKVVEVFARCTAELIVSWGKVLKKSNRCIKKKYECSYVASVGSRFLVIAEFCIK